MMAPSRGHEKAHARAARCERGSGRLGVYNPVAFAASDTVDLLIDGETEIE